MMMVDEDEDEEITARVLRLAGPRQEAPPEVAERVRKGVHRQWRLHTRRRIVQRRVIIGTSVLASAALVVLVTNVGTPRDVAVPPPVETVASVEAIEGSAGLARGDSVRAGQWLETGTGTRVALRLDGGTSMRLDAETRARLLSASVVELTRGAVYLDTSGRPTGLEVRTPLGIARDVGTQFEVRLSVSALRVRVRTGLVELRDGAQTVSARPGSEVTLAAGTAVTKAVPAFGPAWEWATRLGPIFDIDGRSLAAFLDHLSREQGWAVRYGDAELARDASGIILSGSVRGLQPEDAVAVVLRTSGLAHRLGNGELVVMRSAGQE